MAAIKRSHDGRVMPLSLANIGAKQSGIGRIILV
jgi:hypothetical protein